MLWILFLLILMGQCPFLTCQLYEYHFIKEKKSWYEAQLHCKEKYTDLAKVYDMTDVKRLCDLGDQDEAWIGLSNNSGQTNRTWHWSLPGVEFNESETMWRTGQPRDEQSPENCAGALNGSWSDLPCTAKNKFICISGQSDEKLHVIQTGMTWRQAQSYCRENCTDLISGFSQIKRFKSEMKSYQDFVWIGLFRDTWRWSDNSSSSFRNWDLESFKDADSMKTCAKTMSNNSGKWVSGDCNEKKSFFCYKDKLILIKKKKTWTKALYYCRRHHRDLVSITDPKQQRWVQERAKKADTAHIWMGLHYTCTLEFWFWVSDKQVSYENWASKGRADDCDMSAAMDTRGQHKWVTKPDNEEFNFICVEF